MAAANNKVDIDAVLNAANDFYSLAGGAQNGANSAQNGIAALVSGTAGETISLTSNGPLDTRNFDVTAYAAELLQNTTIKGLYELDTSLRQEIRSLDGFLQDLVYKNYAKFINATDTIRKMRDNVVDIDAKLQALSTNVDDITTVNQTISSNLEGHRTRIQEMLVRNTMLQKIKFLVDLPTSMAKGLAEGRYSDVVSEWVKGDAMLTAVLQRHSNVASFTRTQAECRKIAMEVYDKLTNIIRAGGAGIGSSSSPSPADNANTAKSGKSKSGTSSAAAGGKRGSVAASPTSPATATTATSSIEAEDAAMVVRLAFADLKALVPTSIFTDANRPKSIEHDVIGMQTQQCESVLKANIDVAVATVVGDLQDAVAFSVPAMGASLASSSSPNTATVANANQYETCGRALASLSTDMLQQSLKFSYNKYATSVANLQGMIASSISVSGGMGGGGGGKAGRPQLSAAQQEAAMLEEINNRVAATTKASLVHVVDTIYPAIKASAQSLVQYVVLNQSTITDSHRAASEVARIIQSVCEEAFAGIGSLLNGLSRGLKQLSEKFLTVNGNTSAHNALCVMIDDAANGVLRGVLGTLSKFTERSHQHHQQQKAVASKPMANGELWIIAHKPLVAALIAKMFVNYTVEGYGSVGSGSASSSALQGAFASTTRKLVAHFIMIAGQHFSLLFQKEYLSIAEPTDISGPHQTFQLVFRQWMALHSECLAWFPDGQGKISVNRQGVRHERSNSVGSNASSQQSIRPSLSNMASSARGVGNSGLFVIPSVATFKPFDAAEASNANSKFGGGNKRLAIIPTTIDARHIQEAVILNTLLCLEELVRIVHFSRMAFHQLQVDMSFLLQQTGPNSSYWLRDEQLFVNIINAIAVSGYSRTIGEKAPLTQGMVEKLARKDD